MQTKLGVFCDRLIEAGWLTAIIVAPLYFDVYSSRVFEPDKIALVRSIALLMVVAWLAKLLDRGAAPSPAPAPAPAGGDGHDRRPLSLVERISRRNIMALPTLGLVIAYLIATFASITPAISIWGSYQRLQGTFSTFSYIVIFFLAAGAINGRAQVDRVITVILFTTIPISIYGIAQHLKLEFLPWAGDVTLRVTSTMGNPIFIAAYLIMTLPLALGRFFDRLAHFGRVDSAESKGAAKARTRRLVMGALAAVQAVGILMLIYTSLKLYGDAAVQRGSSGLDWLLLLASLLLALAPLLLVRTGFAVFVSASLYGTIFLVQFAATIFSGSRGPWMGMFAGLAIFIFLYTMKINSRRLWLAGVTVAAVFFVGLIVVNVPGSPLAGFRNLPYIGRAGNLLETESGTGKVRILIWEGARNLINPHEPVGVPGQSEDALNGVRPLIGYGPEAMYLAYNKFYPPDLAHYEARNASPDRSHNETFDALITTGILGYFAYWLVFYTVIYAALRFLNVIDDRHGRWLFIALMLTGLVALALVYTDLLPLAFVPAPPLLGVAVLVVYLILAGIFMYDWQGQMQVMDMTLIALVSAIVAHFVEIQFGIAIAATRTHFWMYCALVAAIGYLMLREKGDAGEQAALLGERTLVAAPRVAPRIAALATAGPGRQAAATAPVFKKKVKRVTGGAARPATRPGQAPRPSPALAEQDMGVLLRGVLPRVLPLAVAGGIILATMAFDFMLPASASNANTRTSLVQIWLYFSAWLFCGLLVALDGGVQPGADEVNERLAAFITYVAVSIGIWIIYVLLRTITMGSQTNPLTMVTTFDFMLLLAGVLLAAALYWQRPAPALRLWGGPLRGAAYAVLALAVLVLAVMTNLNVVLADVEYKTGTAYDNAGAFDGSVASYQRALNLTPGQDFYLLFLGRAYMELARQFPDRQASPPYDPARDNPLTITRERLVALGRTDLIRLSLSVLEEAHSINPLNTDHSANLARLYRFWGEVADRSKLETSDRYFKETTTLSPNNAQFWNEWAYLTMLRGDYQQAEARLQRSLELDNRYDMTYFYLGNLYLNQGENAQTAEDQRSGLFGKAVAAYSSCLDVNSKYWECNKARGYLLGKYLNRPQEAINDFLQVQKALPTVQDVTRSPDSAQKQQAQAELVNLYSNLAITYGQLGQIDQAITATQTALQLAPNEQGLKTLLAQFQAQKK